MNLAFTDISSSFANMVQQNIPREFMSDSHNSDWQTSQFAEKLNQIFKKIENGDKSSYHMVKSDTQNNHSEKLMDFLSEKLNDEKGSGFVAALQNIFLILSNNDLNNTLIDADGLAKLKALLLEAGFKESDIDNLMADFLENQENQSISLNELLDKLFDLQEENKSLKEDNPDNYLEISTLPFLESLMNSLQIPDQKVQEILTLADRGDKGLDLDFIISKLQDLQKESFYSGNNYSIQGDDGNFSLLLKQLGIENKYSKGSSFTLTDLVDSLETLRVNKIQNTSTASLEDKNNMGNEKSLDILEALLKGLKFKNSENKIQAFEFSEGQIKNQFKNQLFTPENDKTDKNQLFIPGNSKTDENELFSRNNTNSKHKLDASIKHWFKEIESMLDGKKSSNLVKDQALDNQELFKQHKSEGSRILDKNPISSFNTSINDIQSGSNILKTKASFKNLPNFVTRQVSKNLVQAINQGENSIRVQLKPPELGRLLLTIDNTGSNIKINVITENSAAREILTSNVNELRTTLSNSGVNLERFEVDMSSDFRQSMADAKNQAEYFSKRNKNRQKFLSDSVTKENTNDSNDLLSVLDQNGSVNLVA
ncbi:MAG: flagellar hook-length control protein FliK [Desulfobacula sp.]|nr:flagellar hook-length control protein FliK [Desulfobacula sp.]